MERNIGIYAQGFALLLAFALVSMALSGCVSNGQQPSSSAGGQQQGVSPSTTTADGSAKVSPVLADNKTGYEKTQQTIALAVADGTYSTVSEYAHHSGSARVNFTITVKNDVITGASAVPSGDDDKISAGIIGKFNGALPDLVVGKKITELNIPKNVAGSSLTTAAFKQYVSGLVSKA